MRTSFLTLRFRLGAVLCGVLAVGHLLCLPWLWQVFDLYGIATAAVPHHGGDSLVLCSCGGVWIGVLRLLASAAPAATGGMVHLYRLSRARTGRHYRTIPPL